MSKTAPTESDSDWESDMGTDHKTIEPAVKVTTRRLNEDEDYEDVVFAETQQKVASPVHSNPPQNPYTYSGGLSPATDDPSKPKVEIYDTPDQVAMGHPSGNPQKGQKYEANVDTPAHSNTAVAKSKRVKLLRNDSVSSVQVELVNIDNIKMEPIARDVEYTARRYIREATTAIGMVFSVIMVFVTELVRIILLTIVRPLLVLLRFAVHLLYKLFFDSIYYTVDRICHVFTPVVQLFGSCSTQVCVPCCKAFTPIQIDNRRYYNRETVELDKLGQQEKPYFVNI